MFKRRFQKWGLDKNNKEHEMKAILDLEEQRRLCGRSPLQAVQVGRRKIQLSEVQRYFRRKPTGKRNAAVNNRAFREVGETHDQKVATGEYTSSLLAAQVDWRPVAHVQRPTEMMCSGHNPTPTKFDDISYCVFPSATINRPVPLTFEEMIQQTFIQQTLTFFPSLLALHQPLIKEGKKSFLSGAFLITETRDFFSGMDALHRGRHDIAFRHFDTVFDRIGKAVQKLNPLRLLLFLLFTRLILESKNDALAERLLSYVGRMSRICHGPEHPISKSASSILRTAPKMRLDLIATILPDLRKAIEAVSVRYGITAVFESSAYMLEQLRVCPASFANGINQPYFLVIPVPKANLSIVCVN
jgi:hypothetical protein